MRVIYFHQHFSTPKGATGIRSYEMARRLVEQGHAVTMVCGSFGPGVTGLTDPFRWGRRRGSVDGIDVIEIDLSYSNKDGFAKRVFLFLKFAMTSIGLALREKYDIAFATTTPLTAGLPGLAARWLRRKPFIFEVRDLWPELPRAMGVIKNPVMLWMLSALEWSSYRSAHRCIGLSPGIVDGIARRGVPHERIAMIPNGCDIDLFDVPAETAWRPEGVAESDLMAVFGGTHGPANGLSAVLDAAAQLKDRGRTDIKIVLIGDGKLKPGLVERATQEGLDNVIFHDPVPKTRLAGLFLAADLGIQSLANVPAFYYGTSPNKFFDYISAGLPVLNNYPGWLAGMIEENDCGFAVPPDDAAAFADALERAAADREALKSMGKRSLALAESHFNRRDLSKAWCGWVLDGTPVPETIFEKEI